MRRLALLPLFLLATAAAPVPQGDERRVMITSFERLRVDGPFVVEVAPGSPGAVVTGSARAIDRVDVRIQGDTLVVAATSLGWQTRGAADAAVGPVHIRITSPGLAGVAVNGGAQLQVAELRGSRVDVALSGAGSIAIGSIRADDLGISLSGAGEIRASGSATRARLLAYGSGGIDAAALTSDDAVVTSQTSGAMRLTARYTARVSAMATGSVTVLGAPKCRVSGAGPVSCGSGEAN